MMTADERKVAVTSRKQNQQTYRRRKIDPPKPADGPILDRSVEHQWRQGANGSVSQDHTGCLQRTQVQVETSLLPVQVSVPTMASS